MDRSRRKQSLQSVNYRKTLQTHEPNVSSAESLDISYNDQENLVHNGSKLKKTSTKKAKPGYCALENLLFYLET
ncbi:Hypothetical predicted protein [Paramuricea clavata]|uniref:Uncharacterized protein n=1 Tax=Paramuricea clavata TaxID=317549 RepID=A0A7D9D9L2_PARCT|nr:Hypothetical predicted protein [Paramuricea clavata]